MRIPKHIAIIPDGNRRWATINGHERHEGYNYGLNPGLELLKMAKEYGISEITYYGFTVDNCRRPPEQIEAFSKACIDAVRIIKDYGNVSLLVVGDTNSSYFPVELLEYTTRKNIGNPDIKVNFLVNYGWNWDLSGIDKNSDIKESIKSHDISRIEMVIRWGGMRRLSGLLPVQSVYADFYVIDDMWPDFKNEHFHEAMNWYQTQDVTLGG